MAHNIEIREIMGTKVASFVAVEPAWHQLGQIKESGFTAREAIEYCCANYEVIPTQIAALSPKIMEYINQGLPVPHELITQQIIGSHRATFRTDYEEVLGVVGNRYEIVQNVDAFNFIDLLTTDNNEKANIVSAGVLGRGERIFITAKFPEPLRIDNKEANNIDMYVVFTTSHDGSGAITCMITPTRVVCQNTLNLAFRDCKNKEIFKHTKSVHDKLDLKRNADKAVKLFEDYRQGFGERIEVMLKTKFREAEVNRILGQVLLSGDSLKAFNANGHNIEHEGVSTRARNKFNAVMDSLHNGIGQKELESGTAMWLMNGLTTHYQNHTAYSDTEKKFDSILEGTIQKELQNLFDLAVAV